MMIPFYFLVTPKPALLERLRGEPWVETSDFHQPRLWDQTRPSRLARAGRGWPLRFKLLFLLDVSQVLAAYGASQDLRQEFDAGSISEALFDRYWECMEIDSYDSSDEIEKELEPSVFSRVPRTGCADVDDWLQLRGMPSK
ncbi:MULTISPECIES: hypothetical protein [Corallococcus]|nr:MULTISPECIES: hypothetical protein [Corallococcus]